MKGFRRGLLLILLLSIPVFAYIPSRIVTPSGLAFQKWADSAFPITWRLNTSRLNNIAGTRALVDVTRAAFASWAGVGTAVTSFNEGTTTTVTDAGLDGINLISFVPVSAMPANTPSLTTIYSFSAPSVDALGRSVLFPGQILEADILFNPTVQFTSDATPASGSIDLETRRFDEPGVDDSFRNFSACDWMTA